MAKEKTKFSKKMKDAVGLRREAWLDSGVAAQSVFSFRV
jgi:hypothetical protein